MPARATLPVWAAAAYAGEWRAALVACKERRAWHLVRPLGDALAASVAAALGGSGVATPVLLVPMPSRPAAVRERGLDVTGELARRAASRLSSVGLPTRVDRGLRLVGGGEDQGGLGEAERWRNMAHRLVARPGRPGVRVVVDDITTTGASLAGAVAALAGAGTPALAAAVVAATPRRDGRRP